MTNGKRTALLAVLLAAAMAVCPASAETEAGAPAAATPAAMARDHAPRGTRAAASPGGITLEYLREHGF